MSHIVLLHLNGTDTSTTITNDGSMGTFTAVGNAQLDTAQQKFGTASLLFDGSGDYVQSTDIGATLPATGGWTIDFFVRFNDLSANRTLFDYYVTALGGGVKLYWKQSSTKLSISMSSVATGGSSYDIALDSDGSKSSWSTGVWYHIALVRDDTAGAYYLYVDGVLDKTITTASEATIALDRLRIGSPGFGSSGDQNGWVDEFHIDNTCLFPGGTTFTPPTAEYLPAGYTVGTAAGTGTATGVGAAIFSGVGSAAGVGAAAAFSVGTFPGVGAAAGIGAAAGVGTGIFSAVGGAAGVGAAVGVGRGIASSVGAASGVGAASAGGDVVPPFTGQAIFSLPVTTLEGELVPGPVSTAVFNLPTVRLTAQLIAGETFSAVFRLPVLTFSGYLNEGARFNLPVTTLQATLQTGQVLSSIFRLPVLSTTSTLVLNILRQAQFNLPVTRLQANLIAGGATRSVFSLPVLRVTSTLLPGTLLDAQFVLPVTVLTAQAQEQVLLRAVFNLPVTQLHSDLQAFVAATYQTLVLNTRKGPVTTYDWQFNSYAFFNGMVLAAGPTGVVVLGTHDLDDEAEIDMRVRVGNSDLGDTHLKRVPRIYTGLKTTGDVLFRTIMSETGTRTYRLPYNYVEDYTQRRVPVGKGPKARFWQFEWANENGADLSIKDLLILPNGLRRREQ